MKENSEEDIKNIEEIIELSKEEIDAKDENITAILDIEDLISLEHILSAYKRALKENECLKNHVHYKNCIACGKEFKCKRDDAKYCIKCSKQIANKNYIANLTEEQKLKRREQAKLAMRKLRANRK
mgnify:FL=1